MNEKQYTIKKGFWKALWPLYRTINSWIGEFVGFFSICELRKKIRTRTRARTLARVRCACEIRFELCVQCVCVRGLYGTCELWLQLRNFFFIRRDIVTEFVVPFFFSHSKVVIKRQLFVIKMGIESNSTPSSTVLFENSDQYSVQNGH